MSGCAAQKPAKREREARGRLPRDGRAPRGPAAGSPGSRGRLRGQTGETCWEGHSQISWICRRRRSPQAARPGSGPSSCPGSRGRAPGPRRAAPCPGSRWPVPRAYTVTGRELRTGRYRRRPTALQPAAAPRLISMPGCARLMNIQPRRLAAALLPHFRPDLQPLPMGEGRGVEGIRGSKLPAPRA